MSMMIFFNLIIVCNFLHLYIHIDTCLCPTDNGNLSHPQNLSSYNLSMSLNTQLLTGLSRVAKWLSSHSGDGDSM